MRPSGAAISAAMCGSPLMTRLRALNRGWSQNCRRAPRLGSRSNSSQPPTGKRRTTGKRRKPKPRGRNPTFFPSSPPPDIDHKGPELTLHESLPELAEPLSVPVPARAVSPKAVLPPRVASDRGLTAAVRFWTWISTTPAGEKSRLERRVSVRGLQWRRAAAASGLLALAMTAGFGASVRRNDSSLLPSTLPISPASVRQESTEPASVPPSISAGVSSRAQDASRKEAASNLPSSELSNSDLKTSQSVLARQPEPMPHARPRVTRAAERKDVRGGVVVQHFGTEVVVRHFQKSPPPSRTQAGKAQMQDGVRYYSDLD